MKNGLYSLELL